MSIVVAILALALLIVLHEAGHFLVARLFGMRVERFSIGFGKAVASFKRGDTTYQIAPVPLGGFVQITGMNPHEEFDRNDPYVYPNRPRWMRLAVLLAGPAANYVTALVVALVVILTWGQVTGTTTVDMVIPGSPAEQAGLQIGDTLVAVNDAPVSKPAAITEVVRSSEGAPLSFKVQREGKPLTFTISARKDAAQGVFLIGVRFGQARERGPVGAAVKEAVLIPYTVSAMLLGNIADMITGNVKGSLTGPVGIAREMASAAREGLLRFLELIILLSCALAVFNLLPFPALDGGRAIFLGIAAAVRRDLNPKIETAVHMVGMGLLLLLLVVVTFNDIKQIVIKAVG
jgi:regulator of sigma E protease